MSRSEHDAAALEYVGFGPRLWASVIDSVLVLAICSPLYRWLAGPQDPMRALASADLAHFDFSRLSLISIDGPLDALVNWVLPAIAIVLLWIYRQATPGKMAIRATIVDARTGARPTAMQLAVRYLGYYVSLLPLGLGFAWMVFDPRKQGWHDKLADTVVVRPKHRGPEPVRFGR